MPLEDVIGSIVGLAIVAAVGWLIISNGEAVRAIVSATF